MELALALVGIVLTVVVISAAANKLKTSAPLMLIAAGIALSFLPDMPEYELDPELVLIGILPPLLYSAAYNTSFIDFRANVRALSSLSIGLVVFTTLVVGYVASWLLPGLPLAAGFAIGAVVAPPDAVAATAVARRVGMPRSIVQILEGESLVNDATALTCLRAAIVAIAGTIGVIQIGLDFLLAAGGGVVVGLIIAAIYAPIRRRISNPSIETALSFTIPYIAYIPAEEIHASGVISVVVAGLLIGHKAPLLQSGAARLTSDGNWRTIAFLLENAVFFIIGLQLRSIVDAVGEGGTPITTVVLVCAGVFLATILARIAWVFGFGLLERIPPLNRRRPSLTWPQATVVSWAGMRGVVTLAAALILPLTVPHRDVLVLVAFVVVVGTLLIQGTSLKWLVRALRLPPPSRAEDALEEAALLEEAARAGVRRLDEISDPIDPAEVLARLRARAEERSNAAWERVAVAMPGAQTPTEVYQRMRLEMLSAERAAVLAARDSGRTNDEVLRRVIRVLDVEQAMLDVSAQESDELDHELVTPTIVAQTCAHLQRASRRQVGSEDEPAADSGFATDRHVCGACLREGTTWVHLRMCLECGEVNCCDSSVGKHADRHYRETGHPVMRSVEPGEAWRWCYVDEILG